MNAETDEICALAAALRPREFNERVAFWRSGAGGTWLSEWVSGSREPAIPVDTYGNIRDRLDRELQLAKREYAQNIADAVRLLRACAGLEAKWLFDIEVATEELSELVSDYPSCIGCGETREQWERHHKGARIRIKRGLYQDCYEAFRRSGEEFSVWAGKRKLEATA